jgi:hypothetical protein
MKKFILTLAAVALFANASQAQFFGSKPGSVTVLSSPTNLVTTGSITAATAASVGKNGFAVTATLYGTNAGTANVNFQVYTSHNGTDYTTATTGVGDVAMNGTSVVRKTLYVAPTTIGNINSIKVVYTNAHTASVTISNITVTAFP